MTIIRSELVAPQKDLASRYVYLSSRMLAGITWLSCSFFGIYILVFYAGALISGSASRWNSSLPNLYIESNKVSTFGISIHFAAGGIILALGCVQLLSSVRNNFPTLHRWLGRIYVSACACAGIGGLLFIINTRTIGGIVMDVGFGLSGILMIIYAFQTYRYARLRQLDIHRAWAIRLFALAIGSWLYRMEYGFWYLLTDGLWHTKTFDGYFDKVMTFFFYVPNLLVAEIYLRGRSGNANNTTKFISASIMSVASILLAIATFYYVKENWLPAIL